MCKSLLANGSDHGKSPIKTAWVLTPGASVTISASAKSFKCKCKSLSDDSGERLKAVTLRGGNTLQSSCLLRAEAGKTARAPTYFCTIVCKCHFPLRWCKALLHGTFPPTLSCTARSNVVLNLLSNRTQQFGEMGARRSPASTTPQRASSELEFFFASSRLSAAMLK